ncbi:MAG: glutathione S-transferase family protein [Alphaproteobacteria bacterium]
MLGQGIVKLHCSPGSPYARMARMTVLEKGLGDRVEVVFVQTRKPDSPYYAINPSGRVPYLLRDDGVGFEESAVICDYMDGLDGTPSLGMPEGADVWEWRRLEALARSLIDGLSVWGREIMRPENEQSPPTVVHETARAARMIDLWEREIGHPLMQGRLNLMQMTLACALGLEKRNRFFDWRTGHPRLVAWFERIAARPSFAATTPPN